MINDLDETLKKLLTKKGGLDPAEIDISFEMPDREWSGSISKPTVNLYLYDIRENHDLRNNEWWTVTHDNGVATKEKPPIRIDLSYLITVWTNDMADQHRLLGHLLTTLSQYAEFPEDVLSGALKEVEWPLRVLTAQPDGVMRNSADFWSALDNQLKPSINYVVTIPVDLGFAVSAPEVKTSVFRFRGNGDSPEESVHISGTVHRKGKPDQMLPGATILVKELQMTATTDTEGKYTFNKLGLGSYTFEISAPKEKRRLVPVRVPSQTYDLEL
jgi:hypothetical protein